MKHVWDKIKAFWNNEEGIGTIEILLIIVVIIIIAAMFRKQILGWVNELFGKADTELQNFDNVTTP